MQPRSAKESGDDFPYSSKRVCYIEILKGDVVQAGLDRSVYERAKSGASTLYAVWPGEWRSNLFIIDDLDRLSRAVGFVADEDRTGLHDHAHKLVWRVSPYENKPSASYVLVDLQLSCDCEIKDLQEFGRQMRKQCGWDVSVSGGWGSRTIGGDEAKKEYSIRVRRKSLDDAESVKWKMA